MWLLQPFLRCAKNEEDEAREPHLGVDPISLLAAQDAWIFSGEFLFCTMVKSPSNHHVEEYLFTFSKHLIMQNPKEFIEDCKGLCDVESVEHLGPQVCDLHGTRAEACPPSELKVTVPEDFVQGKSIKTTGPFGEVALKPPPGIQPGESICFRLSPPCQFRVTVPPWAKGGYQARFHLEDGEEVSVKVPEGLRGGDTFEVLPPAMMVKLPTGLEPNDRVIFWSPSKGSRCPEGWYRFRMPQGFPPGAVVSVRIPAMPLAMEEAGADLPLGSEESPLPRVSLNSPLVPNWVRIAHTLK